MTKVKFSGVGVTAMSGSTGSTVTTRNFYGYYQKQRLGAPAVVSPALAAWNGVYSFVHAAYEALTDTERIEWLSAAQDPFYKRIDALATVQRFSGFHLFLHLNLPLALCGLALITTPPVMPAVPPQPTNFSIDLIDPITFALSWTFGYPNYLLFYTSPNMNSGRMSTNQIYTFNSFAVAAVGGISLYTPFFNRFGAPVTGKKIFLKVVPMNAATGIRNTPFYYMHTVS